MKKPIKSDPGQLPPLPASQRSILGELIDQYELAADRGETLSLENLCQGSPDLLPYLIASLRRLKAFDAKISTIHSLTIPDEIGEFRVLEPIGAGATGMVFRCRQSNPDRDIAVKVLKPLLDVDEQQNRFQREMAAFSTVHEAGMAAVYQTGIVDWGGVRCLWIAMELLDGGDICQALKKEDLDEKLALEKFRVVCETLRAAHRLGILHRDIKPSNILLSRDGVPHLVDFGIAKLPGAIAGVQPTETGMRSAQGTAAWMAPELLLADSPNRCDVRSEIFSLGVVLYELLSGQHPFGAEHLSAPQVAARMSQRRGVNLRDLRLDASLDLVAFVSKLMAFDPNDRYQNLDDVISDLDLLLRGEPVKARIVSIRERISRWCRQHWMGVSIVSGVLLTTFGIILSGWIASQKIQHQAELLRYANEKLSQQTTLLQDQTDVLNESLQLRDQTIGNGTLRSLQYIVKTSPSEVHRALNDTSRFPEHEQGFAWRLLNHESAADVKTLTEAGPPIRKLSFDPTGCFLVAASDPDQLSVYDLQTGERLPSQLGIQPSTSLAYRNNGNSVLVVSADHRLIELQVADGKQVRNFSFLPEVGPGFAISKDGKAFAGITRERVPILADLDSREIRLLGDAIKSRVAEISFSEDGTVVHCFAPDIGWRTWVVATAEPLPQVDAFPQLNSLERLHSLEFFMRSPNEELLALGTPYGQIDLVTRTTDGFTVRSIQVRDDKRVQLAILPPSHLITSGGSVQMHDLSRDARPRFFTLPRIPPASSVAYVTAVSPDHQRLAVGDDSGRVLTTNIWNQSIRQRSYHVFRGDINRGFGFPKSLQSFGNRPQFLIGHTGGWIANVDSNSGKAIEAFAISKGPVNAIDVHPNGMLVAFGNGGDDQSLTVLSIVKDGKFTQEAEGIYRELPQPLLRMPLKGDIRCLQFTDDGKHLMAALRNGELLKLDCSDWSVSGRWKCHELGIFGMDTQKGVCVTGGTDGFIQLTNLADGTSQRRWAAHSKRILAVLFSPDGKRIYSASHDGEIRIWSTTGKRLQSLVAHEGPITCLRLLDDGKTLVSGSHDRRILIWDAITGDLQREIQAHEDQITDLEFLPNNGGLISCGLDSEVHLWGVKAGDDKP